MALDFFLSNLILFGIITAGATVGQSYLKQKKRDPSHDAGHPAAMTPQQSGSTRSLYRAYIVVYALVMGE